MLGIKKFLHRPEVKVVVVVAAVVIAMDKLYNHVPAIRKIVN